MKIGGEESGAGKGSESHPLLHERIPQAWKSSTIDTLRGSLQRNRSWFLPKEQSRQFRAKCLSDSGNTTSGLLTPNIKVGAYADGDERKDGK